MSTLYVITGNNLVAPSTNIFQYNFLTNLNIPKHEIALIQGSIFRSWNNISATYGNNTYTVHWINGTNAVLTMPDGIYQITDINNFLQAFLVQQKWYLIDNNGNNNYQLAWSLNTIYYNVELTSDVIPTVLPAGWSIPAGATWVLPGVATTPQVIIPADEGSGTMTFGSIIGFNSGTYPSVTTANIISTSQNAPEVDPVNTVFIRCNAVNCPLSTTPDLIFSFGTAGVAAGTQIVLQPAFPLFVPMIDNFSGKYLQFTFTDQNLVPLVMKDTSITFTFCIRPRIKNVNFA